MKQIEDKTCIKFNKVKPVKDQPWLFVSRDARANDKACQRAYVKSTYVGKDVAGLGDIYKRFGWVTTGACFGGAYAWYGSDSPQNFGISKTTLTDDNQGDIGLVVHELLHNLGVGHTQKRQDASRHIYIDWGNIQTGSHGQYKPCIESEDRTCSRYNDYGTPYDCMSIMHYRDTFFLTREAGNRGAKTMTAKRPSCDLKSHANRLSQAEIDILTKMYCKDKIQENVIKSPNHPANYPDNANEEYPVSVEAGSVIR